MYSAPYNMGHLSKIEINMTHFYTKINFLLALWKDLAKLNLKQIKALKKYLMVKLCGKEIFTPWGPNISLPDGMGRYTYIVCHQKAYRHVIIYICFYVDTWYWKYTRTQARRQAPRPRGRRKNMARSEGKALLNVDNLKTLYCSIESPWYIMN